MNDNNSNVQNSTDLIEKAAHGLPTGINGFLSMLLDPEHNQGFQPDMNDSPCIFKLLRRTREYMTVSTSGLVLLYCPGRHKGQLVMYNRIAAHPILGTPCLGFVEEIALDEEVSDSFASSRVTAAKLKIICTTRSGAVIDLSGTVTATILNDHADYRSFDPAQLTAINSQVAIQSASITDGVVTLFFPEGANEFRSTDAHAIWYNNGWNRYWRYITGEVADAGFDFTGLIAAPGTSTIWSSRVGTSDSIPGYLNGKIRMSINAALIEPAVPTGVITGVSVEIIRISSAGAQAVSIVRHLPVVQNAGFPAGTAATTINGDLSFECGYYIDEIRVRVTTSAAFTVVPTVVKFSVQLEAADVYTRSSQFPLSVITLQNHPIGMALSITACEVHELVPNLDLSKQIMPQVQISDTYGDYHAAQQFIRNPAAGVRPLLTGGEYELLLRQLDVIAQRGNVIAYASSFGDVMKKIGKGIMAVGRPIVSTALRTFAPGLAGPADSFMKGIGFAGDGYGSKPNPWLVKRSYSAQASASTSADQVHPRPVGYASSKGEFLLPVATASAKTPRLDAPVRNPPPGLSGKTLASSGASHVLAITA